VSKLIKELKELADWLAVHSPNGATESTLKETMEYIERLEAELESVSESWERIVKRIVPDFPEYAECHPASAAWAVWTDRNRIREALLKLKPAPQEQK
jgi:hypothetical protein